MVLRRSTLRSTQFLFGGLTFVTDNDEHPLLTSIQRLIDIWTLVGIQINAVLIVLEQAARLHIQVCQRLLAFFDVIGAIGYGLSQAGPRMVEDWGLFWFKFGWNYD